MVFDSPIKTVEEAKRFFQAMGCSSFHMTREFPDRYDEYCNLVISKEVEAEWTAEKIGTTIERLKLCHTDAGQLWAIHSTLADLVLGGGYAAFLEDVLDVSGAIEHLLPLRDRLLVAETIVGRQAVEYRSGLIFQSRDTGRIETAKAFSALAHRLVGILFTDAELETRRKRLLSVLAQTEKLCGIGAN